MDDEQGLPSWEAEALAVIEDIKKHVKTVEVSKKLICSDRTIYFNLATIEGAEFCIEMSGCGFAVVGEQFDAVDLDASHYYETPYSLLNNLSAEYRKLFGNELIDKLKDLEEKV